MTPLAPPTEAEVKEWRDEAEWVLRELIGPPRLMVFAGRMGALCDAYLAQRELLKRCLPELVEQREEHEGRDSETSPLEDEVCAALSAAPLAPETQNEGDG